MFSTRAMGWFLGVGLSLSLGEVWIPAAQATLGELDSSIEQVRRSTRTLRRAPDRRQSGAATYSVHTLEKNGIRIREYVNTSGRVFAVTYFGYRSPADSVLLGKFQTEYENLVRSQPQVRGSRSRSLSSSRLSAVRSGHPRALRGKFLARELAPAHFDFSDLE